MQRNAFLVIQRCSVLLVGYLLIISFQMTRLILFLARVSTVFSKLQVYLVFALLHVLTVFFQLEKFDLETTT